VDSDITQDWTLEEETALRHKIDRRIVPLVTILYLLCVCMTSSPKIRFVSGIARETGVKRD